MGNSDELREILERLKGEAGEAGGAPAPAAPGQEFPARGGWLQRQPKPARQQAPVPAARPRGVDLPRENPAVSGAVSAWRENKEAMLFGILTSLIMAMGGVLAGLESLVYLGALAFLVFAGIMALALFAAVLPRRAPAADPRLNARVDTLSAKVELLSSKLDGLAGEGTKPEGQRNK